MKGKQIFTYAEAEQIRKLIEEKLVSNKEKQKKIRDKIRDIGFYMTDFSGRKGYTVSDFERAVKVIPYDIGEHTHRFAVWTAARAVQRSFTTTEHIKSAIEESGLREFVNSSAYKTNKQFDDFHTNCAAKIIAAFKAKDIEEATYGRAAKIIAVYLKTAVVIGSGGKDKRCKIIHPPIDHTLLSKISRFDDLKELRNKRWTQLNKEEYREIVDIIRKSEYKFDWTLEEYWKLQ